MDEVTIKMIWIRHGATRSNEEHRYIGKTDEELSDYGIQELVKQKSRFWHQYDYIISSPMKRCITTADILFDRQPDYLISDWREMDFGSFEGKNYKELKGNAKYQEWIDSNGMAPFPNGESRQEFVLRCQRGLKEVLTKIRSGAAKEKELYTAAAVVHGGTIMAVLSSLTGKEYFDFQVKNGMGYETVIKATDENVKLAKIECI